jgi:hypothetical protein
MTKAERSINNLVVRINKECRKECQEQSQQMSITG